MTNDELLNDFLDMSKAPQEIITDKLLITTLHNNGLWSLQYFIKNKSLEPPYSQPGVPIKYSTGLFWHCYDCQVRDIYRNVTESKLAWDVIYTYDKRNNRYIDIPTNDEKKTNFVNIMGCSMAFGFGLNDKETWSYKLANVLPKNYSHYNSARVGSAPHNTLYSMEIGQPVFDHIKENDNGLFIYLFSEQIHLPRVNGFAKELFWIQNSPYYEYEDNKLVTKGTFMERRYFTSKFYMMVNTLYSKFKNIYNLNFPAVSSYHRKVTCDVMAAIRDKTIEKYPNSKFVIYHYPVFGADSLEIVNCFREKGITYIKPKRMDMRPSNIIRLSLPYDNHPNEKMSDLMTKDLFEQLKKLSII